MEAEPPKPLKLMLSISIFTVFISQSVTSARHSGIIIASYPALLSLSTDTLQPAKKYTIALSTSSQHAQYHAPSRVVLTFLFFSKLLAFSTYSEAAARPILLPRSNLIPPFLIFDFPAEYRLCSHPVMTHLDLNEAARDPNLGAVELFIRSLSS